MVKQILPIFILLIGIAASVLLIQNSTLLKSKAYDLLDFVPAFHSSENDVRFNGNLDVYKDGIINAFDVIKDRYLQQATKSATPSAEATSSAEATQSATPAVTVSPSPMPTITPMPTPTPNTQLDPASQYQKILNGN